MKKILSGFVFALFISCTPGADSGDLKPLVLLSPEGKEILLEVEIADSPEERAKGLMYRTELRENTGILFVFNEEEVLTFWMKNTLIPLEIFFIDASNTIVSMESMIPCPDGTDCSQYSSNVPAKYALEVEKGFIEQHGIDPGWRMLRKL